MATLVPGKLADTRKGIWVATAEAFLEFRRALLEDDWDDDSPRPEPSAISRAWHIFCRSNLHRVAPSAVVPSAKGGVGISYVRNGRYADFECFNNGTVLWVISDRHGNVDVFPVDAWDDAEVDNAISRIARFVGYSEQSVQNPL